MSKSTESAAGGYTDRMVDSLCDDARTDGYREGREQAVIDCISTVTANCYARQHNFAGRGYAMICPACSSAADALRALLPAD